MGVMVDLGDISAGAVIWGWGSPFLVILVPSNSFSSATVWASCVTGPDGLFVYLSAALLGTSAARQDRSVWSLSLIFLILGSVIALEWV